MLVDMFPSREMNRSFQTPRQDNEHHSYNPNLSPFNQTINRSSSSADSTSPEMYTSMDIGPHTSMYSPLHSPCQDFFKRQVPNSPTSSMDHPSTPVMKRHRPIIGRQIVSNFESLPATYETPMQVAPMTKKENFSNQSLWQPEETVMLQQTPPSNMNYFIENKNYYELFPCDKRGLLCDRLFRTPPKTSPTSSSVSPSQYSVSPMTANSQNAFSPLTNQTASRPFYPNHSPNVMQMNNPRFSKDMIKQKMCTFCRKNGETPVVYMNHMVKEKVDNKWIVTCPILRSHVCSSCGASGDDAHTITYCPFMRSCNNGLPLQSTTITLKNTRFLSNGRRRY